MSAPQVISALTTPFAADGTVDLAAARRAARAVAPHVDAVFLCGTTGEFPALEDAERLAVFEAVLDELGQDRVIAQVGAASTRGAVRLAAAARELGIRRMAALTPYYLPASADEVRGHFSRISEAAGGDLYAYVFPERTGITVSPAEVAALPGITGVKLSGEPSARVGEYTGTLAVYSGNDADLVNVMERGGTGIVSGCSSAFPEPFRALAAAIEDRDAGRIRACQARVDEVVAAIGASIGRVKYAQRARGLHGDTARMTVAPPRDTARIDLLVKEYGCEL